MLGAIFAEAPEADAYLAAAAQAAEAEAMAMASEIVEAAEIGAKDEQFDAQDSCSDLTLTSLCWSPFSDLQIEVLLRSLARAL